MEACFRSLENDCHQEVACLSNLQPCGSVYMRTNKFKQLYCHVVLFRLEPTSSNRTGFHLYTSSISKKCGEPSYHEYILISYKNVEKFDFLQKYLFHQTTIVLGVRGWTQRKLSASVLSS